MKRLSFSDVEAICEQQNCRFNDLFLIGNDVFVMLDSDNSRLPPNHRPLLLEDPEVQSALPEVLRRLDAAEFESMEEFERTRLYNAAHTAEFEKLKYQLYDLLTAASRERKSPDRGQFYLELEGTAGEGVLLVCDSAESLDEPLVASIQGALRSGNYSLDWRVRVSLRTTVQPFELSRRTAWDMRANKRVQPTLAKPRAADACR
jgi:hypothetical protein